MDYIYCITFSSDDSGTLDNLRDLFSTHLKTLNLRYKSEKYYPQSGWNTPSIEEKEEVSFLIKAPKYQPENYKVLVRQAVNDARQFAKNCLSDVTVSTEGRL